MKTKILFPVIFLSMAAFSMISCKKHHDDNTVTPAPTTNTTTTTTTTLTNTGCPIAYIRTDRGDSLAYIYDAQNRLTAINTYSLSGNSKKTYTYATGQVIIAENGTQKTITLNSDGTAKYEASSIRTSTGSMEYDTTFYTYDSNGYNTRSITKRTDMSNPKQSSYDSTLNTYTNGNLTYSKIFSDVSAGTKITLTYTYTTLASKFLYDPNLPLNLYGKESTNLVDSETFSMTGTVSSTSTTIFAYKLNTDGYITTSATVLGSATSAAYYHYNCK